MGRVCQSLQDQHEETSSKQSSLRLTDDRAWAQAPEQALHSQFRIAAHHRVKQRNHHMSRNLARVLEPNQQVIPLTVVLLWSFQSCLSSRLKKENTQCLHAMIL